MTTSGKDDFFAILDLFHFYIMLLFVKGPLFINYLVEYITGAGGISLFQGTPYHTKPDGTVHTISYWFDIGMQYRSVSILVYP